MKSEIISGICGLILTIVSLIVICVRLFGDYPPSNINYLWLGGAFIGGMLAAPLVNVFKNKGGEK